MNIYLGCKLYTTTTVLSTFCVLVCSSSISAAMFQPQARTRSAWWSVYGPLELCATRSAKSLSISRKTYKEVCVCHLSQNNSYPPVQTSWSLVSLPAMLRKDHFERNQLTCTDKGVFRTGGVVERLPLQREPNPNPNPNPTG